eukprot:9237711-Pyramimonas_sp.AAC.1
MGVPRSGHGGHRRSADVVGGAPLPGPPSPIAVWGWFPFPAAARCGPGGPRGSRWRPRGPGGMCLRRAWPDRRLAALLPLAAQPPLARRCATTP